jgi:trans-AT polyketide synthase/acyltransferase/oxidoreductase domain-containing protein
VFRTELAEMTMQPPPAAMVQKLLAQGYIKQEQAVLAPRVPMSDDVAVEADRGGHMDNRPFAVIFPLIVRTRDRLQAKYKFHPRRCRLPRVGRDRLPWVPPFW